MSMTISLYTLNHHSSHGLGFMSKHRRQKIAKRKYSVHAVPPSSIIPKKGESGNSTDSKKDSQSNAPHVDDLSGASLLTHSNSVGIIGGASIKNNLSFVNKLVKWSSMNEEDSIPFVLCSDPLLSRELLSHERSYFPLLAGKSKDYLFKDHTPIVANLNHKRCFLENAGARCIVMPCHTSHSWYNEVAEGCSVPFLHIGDCVAKELKEAKLKPLEAGSPLRIGVIAANAILEAGFYQEKLHNEGFEVVLPDKATMEHTLVPAMEALKRKDKEGAQNLFRIALQVLLVRAVNTVILASDDLQDLLPLDDPLLKKCVDPMDALARSTIKFAQSAEIPT